MSEAVQDNRPEDFIDLVPLHYGAPGDSKPAAEKALEEGKALQQTKTKYHTAVAVQKARDLDRIVANVMREANYAGADFYYSWQVWDKRQQKHITIEGPTIGAAMSLYREWGNCALDIEFQDMGAYWMFKPYFVDLETGATVTRAFRYKPSFAPGKYDDNRWQDMQFQLAQSKAIRNVVTAAMPKWLINQMVQAAKKAELSYIDRVGIAEARARAVEFYGKMGVSEARLVAYLGKARKDWINEDVAILRNLGRQSRDGEIDLQEVFPEVAEGEQPKTGPAEPQDAPKSKTKAKAKAKPESPPEAESGAPEPPSGMATASQVDQIIDLLEKCDAPGFFKRDMDSIMLAIDNLDKGGLKAETADKLIADLEQEPAADINLVEKAIKKHFGGK